MSNVLIGIIGVILFIGLALAGALILGDDFKSSQSSTAAAKIVSDMQQISAAMNMRSLKTGTQMVATNYDTNVAALTPRFLKVVPTIPISNNGYRTVDIDGYGRNLPVHHIQALIGPASSDRAKAICKEIEAQTGAADPETAIANIATAPGWSTRISGARKGIGCFLYSGSGDPQYNAFLVI